MGASHEHMRTCRTGWTYERGVYHYRRDGLGKIDHSSNLVRTIRAVGPFAGLPPEVLANAIDETRDDLGLKLDTSHMSTQETIDAIVPSLGWPLTENDFCSLFVLGCYRQGNESLGHICRPAARDRAGYP